MTTDKQTNSGCRIQEFLVYSISKGSSFYVTDYNEAVDISLTHVRHRVDQLTWDNYLHWSFSVKTEAGPEGGGEDG